MNIAYGEPSRESLPFDLAHHRFPITYNLPEGTPSEARKTELDRLSKSLSAALRSVLDSDEYKSSLPKAERLPEPKYREPGEGRARFRRHGQPIGYSGDHFSKLTGQPDVAIALQTGPAMWMRVGPRKPLQSLLKLDNLKPQLLQLVRLPLFNYPSNAMNVRSGDGLGWCTPAEDGRAGAVVFAFTDGEIWVTDTEMLAATPQLIPFNEAAFAKTLEQAAGFLSDSLKVAGPYRWIAGLEGVKGRAIPVPNNRFGMTRGPCADELIEFDGSYEQGQDPGPVLEAFFDRVFEVCGVSRPASPKPGG